MLYLYIRHINKQNSTYFIYNWIEMSESVVIKENTLKYHNKNIYSKLGVSSRKQLLHIASLISEENWVVTPADPHTRKAPWNGSFFLCLSCIRVPMNSSGPNFASGMPAAYR